MNRRCTRSFLFFVLSSFALALGGCGGSNPDDVFNVPPPVVNDVDAAPGTPARAVIRIATTGTPTTTEAGGRATFTVALSAKPSSEVVVPVTSPSESEIKVEPSALTFGSNDWDQPKTVTLIGQKDDVADGDQKVLIGIGPSTSSDAAWNGVRGDAVEAVNKDDDVAGIEVSTPSPSSATTETGTKVTFTVRLKSRPTASVTIGVTSSVPTEGAVDKAQLVFGENDWQTPQTVTVTGQDDVVADQDKAFDVDLAKPVSTDAKYAALAASKIALTNLDDDIPGFFVFPPAPTDRFTTENGGTTTFTVRLRSKPKANVTIPLSSTKTAEGSLEGVTQLVFTAANYDQLQTVTVKGVDEKIDDGDQPFAIALAAASSTDGDYQGKDAPDIDLTNRDDDTASIMVSAPSANITTEAGNGAVTFTVQLGSEPTAPVTLALVSTKPTEGAVDKAELVFNAGNWNVAQTVTVTGQQELVDDGDQQYDVQITHKAGSVTTDAVYAAIEPNDITLTNSDDDTQGVTVTGPRGGTETTEAGGFVFIDVVLKTKPTGEVTIPVSISNGEAEADVVNVKFTADDWNVSKPIKITGKQDDVDDGDVEFTVVLGTATGGGYNVDAADVKLMNVDDDTAQIVQGTLTGALTEVGGQAKFTVRLATRPAGANVVTVPITITAGNATRSPTSLQFTTANWMTDQEVTITGAGDGLLQSTVATVTVVVGPASGDSKYDGLSAPGFTGIANTSACGIGGTNAGEGETCDDANTIKCDGCEGCVKQSWAVVPTGSVITTASAAAVTAAGTTMCIDAWAKIGGGADGIIAGSITNDLDVAFALACDGSGRLSFASQSGVDVIVAEALATTCANGQWHHVAGCRALDGVDLTYRVFLDGALVGTSAAGTTAAIGSAAPIRFGDKLGLGTGGLDGAIDEVHLHKTLRTASFTPERHPAVTAETVAIWRLNEGTGTTSASVPTSYAATLGAGATWSDDAGYSTAVCQ